MDNDETLLELIAMASEGLLLGCCPSCNIPLDFDELKARYCRKCGDVDSEQIIWKLAETQGSC